MKLIFSVFVICSMFFNKPTLGDVRYEIIGLDMFYPTGISVENGQINVAGVSATYPPQYSANSAILQTVGSNTVNIGTLPGGISSGAYGIHGNTVVGQSHFVDANGIPSTRAFMYQNGNMQGLDNVSEYSSALDINSFGNIVGFADFGLGGVEFPCLWNAANGSMTRVGNVPRGGAQAINEHNVVVGFMDTNDERKAAILYSLDGDMVPLDIPGASSMAHDINDRGAIVGYFINDTGNLCSFVRQPDGLLEFPNIVDGYSNVANSINSDGLVVGQYLSAEVSFQAYVWSQADGTRDLNDFIDPATGWSLNGATSINDSGYIVGYGVNPNGEFQGFLLVPIPCPGSMSALIAFSAVILKRRTRNV